MERSLVLISKGLEFLLLGVRLLNVSRHQSRFQCSDRLKRVFSLVHISFTYSCSGYIEMGLIVYTAVKQILVFGRRVLDILIRSQ